jgi:ABC-type histidine transport system ATPase subunit
MIPGVEFVLRVPTITVTDLRKAYGPLQSLKGISFTAQPGEIFSPIHHRGQ